MWFILPLLLSLVHGAMWRDENIRATLRLKHCFSRERASLIETLFPPRSLERAKREAIALDHLARLIKTGVHFCDALRDTVKNAHHHLKGRLLTNSSWQETLTHFEEKKEQSLARCDAMNQHGDVRSKSVKCIDRVMRESIYALIVAQYAEDEQGVYQ